MYVSEIYCKVCIGQLLSDAFPIHCGLKKADALSPLLFNSAQDLPLGQSKKPNRVGNEWETLAACLC